MAASLLDDPVFLAELDKLDEGLDLDTKYEEHFEHRPTLDEWAAEAGIVLSPPDHTRARRAPRATWRMTWQVMNAVAFLALVFVGAGAAAVLFHDRVLRLLTTW